MRKYISVLVLLGMTGCYAPKPRTENDKVEVISLEVKENKASHFFDTGDDFTLSAAQIKELESVLKRMNARGESNIGIMLISSKPATRSVQEKAKKALKSTIYKYGFIDSRIVDSGLAVYDSARTGVRVDVLKYKAKDIDTGLWKESPGDHCIQRDLPQYGGATSYNFGEMIANTADVVVPREYKGQKTEDAVAAIGASGSSGGGSSSSSSSSSD